VVATGKRERERERERERGYHVHVKLLEILMFSDSPSAGYYHVI
jgi:hypothetical protein